MALKKSKSEIKRYGPKKIRRMGSETDHKRLDAVLKAYKEHHG